MKSNNFDRRLCILAEQMNKSQSASDQDRINTNMHRLIVANGLPLNYIPARCSAHNH